MPVRSLFQPRRSGRARADVGAPLAQPLQVQFRQLAEVSEEGRLQRVILLLYHPLCADGLVDLDDLHSLALPALEEQTDLLEILQARTPQT